jgi:hypothetical protein
MRRRSDRTPKIWKGVTVGVLAAAVSCAALVADTKVTAAHSSDPVHGSGASHNPQSPSTTDPYHGAGSSHNPIVYPPQKRHLFVTRQLPPSCKSGLCATKPGTPTHPGGPGGQ